MPLLEAEGVSVVFGRPPDGIAAVDEVSLSVERGEAVGVVGESGSGKTTLGRVLVGLQLPTRGRVLFGGRVVVDAVAKARWRRPDRLAVQMIFQDPYASLNPRLRAWETVAEALSVCRGLDSRGSRNAAFELLARLGLSTEQGHLFPRALSGGQQQRVSVARALAADPRLLIADEPTSSIDQSIQAQLLNLIRELQVERNLTVVFVSHDLAVIRYLTDRTYVMRAGRFVENGPTEEVFQRPRHEYTRSLIDSIPGRQRISIDKDTQ